MNRFVTFCLLVFALFASSASRAQSLSTAVPKGAHYPKIPTTTTITSVSPNPFKVKTTLSYKLKSAGHMTIKVLDVKGNEIATLFNDEASAGAHTLVIRGDVFTASGTYYCKLTWQAEPPVTVNLSVQK